MLYTSRDKSSPSKVLKQVFQNLARKEDIKTCLLVCKSWSSVAQDYFDRNISIVIKNTDCEDLMEDILIIGQNVKAIKIRPHKFSPVNEHNEVIWRTILGFCPHITSIYFLKSRSILPLLEALQDPDLMLNDLQKIEARELESYPLKIQDLFLQVNAHYRKKITSLRLYALTEIPRTIKYDGLAKFISQFSRLTCLKVNSPFSWESIGINRRRNPALIIDIKNLFEEAPQLKEVKLYDCDIVATGWRDTNTGQIIGHISLITLKIKTYRITTSIFQYIVVLLKQVKSLHLIIGEITPDEIVLEEEFLTILNNLKAYTSAMETAKLKYNYRGQNFSAIEDDYNDDDYATDSNYSDDEDDFFYNDYGDDDYDEYNDDYIDHYAYFDDYSD